MEEEKKVQQEETKKKDKKPNWFHKNWKKLLVAAGGIGGTLWVIAKGIAKAKSGEYDFNPYEIDENNLPDWEKMIPEMADEYGVIHKNVLRQDLDGETAYWFKTSELIDPNKSEE